MLNHYINTIYLNDQIVAQDRFLKTNKNEDELNDEPILKRSTHLKHAILNATVGVFDNLIGLGQLSLALVSANRLLKGDRLINYGFDSLQNGNLSLRYTFVHALKIISPTLEIENKSKSQGIMTKRFFKLAKSIASKSRAYDPAKKQTFFSKNISSRLISCIGLITQVVGRVLDAALAIPAVPLAFLGAGVTAVSGYEFKRLNQAAAGFLEFPMIIHDIACWGTRILFKPYFQKSPVEYS